MKITVTASTHEGADTASAPSKWVQLRRAKELLPEVGRFHLCHEAAQKRSLGVGVYVKNGSAWFGGLIRCGSVWICPVCARRVSEIRKEEIQGAIDNAIRADRGVLLVTHTFPHGAGDVLADILQKFTKAQRASKSGRAAVALRTKYGFIGEIRTLEVTHGVNGWHPHAHSIWITEEPLTQEQIDQLQSDLYEHWMRACLKAGLPEPSKAHGVDVRGARYAAAYVAKWGFAMEVAGGTSKRGKKESGGRTPWQLLADATEGDRRAGWLWREFALAFFGKRQLFWSRGLRDKLELPPELTDQAALDLKDENAERHEQVIMLDLNTWHVVRRAGAQERLLLYAAEDRLAMYGLLNHLRSTVPMQDGNFLGPKEEWET